MANYTSAYELMIRDEGGYQLHTVEGDTGGMTYAGIARNKNPQWPGWASIDRGETPATSDVRAWYKATFWDAIRGDELAYEATASSIFNFAVNAGQGVAIKLAQLVVGATPDGVLGNVTLQALNSYDPALFKLQYGIAKITRYAQICNRDRSQSKFLLGWVNRTLKGLA